MMPVTTWGVKGLDAFSQLSRKGGCFRTTAWRGVCVCRQHALAYSTCMGPTHLSSFSPHLQRHLFRIPVGGVGAEKGMRGCV